MKNISIRKMWVFICAVEAGNFTEGARRANISQPAAVSIIGEIEDTVGEPLFERSGKTRRARLTPRGDEVYETFVRTLAVYERALDTICAGKQKRRAQKILIQSPYVASVSALWLRKMTDRQADTPLSIRSAGWREIVSAIENRDECMALIDGDVRPKNSEYIAIGNVETVFVIPETSSYFNADLDEMPWEDVPADTLVYSDICPSALERTYRTLRRAQNCSNAFIEVNCASILKNFCQKTGLPAIGPRNLVDFFGDGLRVRSVPFAYSKPFVPVGLSVPHGNQMRTKVAGRNIENVFENHFYV